MTAATEAAGNDGLGERSRRFLVRTPTVLHGASQGDGYYSWRANAIGSEPDSQCGRDRNRPSTAGIRVLHEWPKSEVCRVLAQV